MNQSCVILGDCMEIMPNYPDKYFDLAVIDPPYGIGEDGGDKRRGNKTWPGKIYTKKNWDKEPMPKAFFDELRRISKNQIIWGANHFISRIPFDSPGWLVWDKDNTGDFADCELAYTSFNKAVRKFKWRWNGMLQQNMKQKEKRIHPTQKPVALYDWIFQNYAEPGQKIIDTHLGSGSSRIAAHKAKLDFTGIEIDKEYFDNAQKRYEDFARQLALF